jgi:hypothetical protein
VIAQAEPGAAAFRAVLDSVFASRAYRWAETPPLLALIRDWWRRLGDWLYDLRLDNPTAFRLLIFGLLIALVLVLAHGAWVVWRTLGPATSQDEDGRHQDAAVVRDAAWYFREADRAATEGRMGDALQLAFVGLALTLDARGLLRYHPSKTPAECVRDARLAGDDRERLRELVRSLYAHAFGGRPCGSEEYRRWRGVIAGPWHAPAG